MPIDPASILVSVYLPTCNRQPLLQAAIDSVLNQTHAALELLVVNDGSTDGTRDYLDHLTDEQPRVRVFHHDKPLGAPRSRNEAIRMARGEWVTGLDDDDEFEPARIEGLLNHALLLERMDVKFSALYSQYYTVREDGSVPTAKRGSANFADLLVNNCVGNQIFARKQVFLDAGLFDEQLSAWQDLDLILRVVRSHGPARLLDAPLYRFRDDDREDRISRRNKSRVLAAYDQVAAKYPDISPAARRALYWQVFGEHYAFPVQWRDLKTFVRMGATPREIVRMLATAWRRRKRT